VSPITASTKIAAFLLITGACSALGHGGRLDNEGGHYQRATGEYHCHRETCTATGEKGIDGHDGSSRYERKDWPHWIDADKNCRNTRHEILLRDSLQAVTFKTGRRCRVLTGHWIGSYTGITITNAGWIDIDHVIPLKWAHDHGGAHWSRDKKRQFANDPDNLEVSSRSANRSKGAKGIDEWMPAIGHCDYAMQWQQLVEKYRLAPPPGVVNAINNAC
jgi:hypothetical protein